MGYCQEVDEKHPTQQYRQAEGCYQHNRSSVMSVHSRIISMPSRIDEVIHAKGEVRHFCALNLFIIDHMKYSCIFMGWKP